MEYIDLQGVSLDAVFQLEENQELDTPQRHAIRKKCCLGRFLQHPCSSKEADLVEKTVKDLFKEKSKIHNKDLFNQVWSHVLREESIGWNKHGKITAGLIKRIDVAFNRTVLYHGSGVQAYPNKTFQQNDTEVQKAVKHLFQGQELRERLMGHDDIRGVYKHEKKEELIADFRQELQSMVTFLMDHLPANEREEELFRLFITNLIAFVPFTFPKDGDVFSLPQKLEGGWKLMEYRLERIELTPSDVISPITAVGFVPTEKNPKAHPILSFVGTTSSGADGNIATVMADFTPGLAVGKWPFLQGRKKLDAWFKGKENVHVNGVSLGGALSFHALNRYKNQLSCVSAMSPAGLFPWEYKGTFDEGPEVYIYHQNGDIIPRMAMTPTGKKVRLIKVIPFEDGHKESLKNSHARAYAGADLVTLLRVDAKRDNRSLDKIINTILHLMFSWIIFLPLSIVYAVNFLSKKIFTCCKKLKQEELKPVVV